MWVLVAVRLVANCYALCLLPVTFIFRCCACIYDYMYDVFCVHEMFICDQEVIHRHIVQRISFIARDVSDARAFGYVYGCRDGRHQFYGIKTEKVVCCRPLWHGALTWNVSCLLEGDWVKKLSNQTTKQGGCYGLHGVNWILTDIGSLWVSVFFFCYWITWVVQSTVLGIRWVVVVVVIVVL